MSVSPRQNFSKPPPVPDVPTVTFTPECCSWNSSAATVLSGATVLEPSTLMLPDSLAPEELPPSPPASTELPASAPPQAANASTSTGVTRTGDQRPRRLLDTMNRCPLDMSGAWRLPTLVINPLLMTKGDQSGSK